jgi:hypothetical protein
MFFDLVLSVEIVEVATQGIGSGLAEHPVDGGEVLSRISQHFGIGGMVGTLDGDDGAAQVRMFVSQKNGELLLGLRGTDDQNFMCPSESMRHFLKKPRIGGSLVSAMSALAAMNVLMLIVRVDHGAGLLGGGELPGCCLLMIDPNDGVKV